MKKRLLAVLVLALMSCSAGYSAIVWTNTAGGAWSDATSWSPNQVPSTGDDAAITNDGIYTVTTFDGYHRWNSGIRQSARRGMPIASRA